MLLRLAIAWDRLVRALRRCPETRWRAFLRFGFQRWWEGGPCGR